MDSKIRSYFSIDIGDGLDYCARGIVYQRDTTHLIEYAEDYFENYQKYENSNISDKLNEFRVNLIEKYVRSVLDVGIGCGTFLKRFRGPKLGYDINHKGVEWLQERSLYFDPYIEPIPKWIQGVALFDVMEHMPNPDLLLNRINPGMFVFISIPIFKDFVNLRQSRHFKPQEHLTYWQYSGLVSYFKDMNFSFIESSDEETKIGRDSIESFVFKKVDCTL